MKTLIKSVFIGLAVLLVLQPKPSYAWSVSASWNDNNRVVYTSNHNPYHYNAPYRNTPDRSCYRPHPRHHHHHHYVVVAPQAVWVPGHYSRRGWVPGHWTY